MTSKYMLGLGSVKANLPRSDSFLENVNSISELEQAFIRAKKSKTTYVISIKTDGYQWLEGSAYWESPTLTKPSTKENEKALKEHLQGKSKQRQGV